MLLLSSKLQPCYDITLPAFKGVNPLSDFETMSIRLFSCDLKLLLVTKKHSRFASKSEAFASELLALFPLYYTHNYVLRKFNRSPTRRKGLRFKGLKGNDNV